MSPTEYAGVTAPQTVRPRELAHTIAAMLECDQHLMIWGAPGLGKSDISRQVAEELGYIYHDIRPMLMERVDLLGVPYVSPERRTLWASPGFLPDQQSQEKHFLNLEELPNARPDMQSALYQLVLDRRCGDYQLPPGARLVACGNRLQDRGGVHRMPAPLASRFVHVELETSVDDWLEWAVNHGIDPDILFFLRFQGDCLNDFDPRREEPAFACPRTWASLSRIKERVQDFDLKLQSTIYRGTVGEAAATAFTAFPQL